MKAPQYTLVCGLTVLALTQTSCASSTSADGGFETKVDPASATAASSVSLLSYVEDACLLDHYDGNGEHLLAKMNESTCLTDLGTLQLGEVPTVFINSSHIFPAALGESFDGPGVAVRIPKSVPSHLRSQSGEATASLVIQARNTEFLFSSCGLFDFDTAGFRTPNREGCVPGHAFSGISSEKAKQIADVVAEKYPEVFGLTAVHRP